MEITINKGLYKIAANEYSKIQHNEYTNLKLYNEIGLHERIIGLIKKCKEVFFNLNNNNQEYHFINFDTTHGGFIPINLSNDFNGIYLFNTSEDNIKNIRLNKLDIKNIYEINNYNEISNQLKNIIIYSEKYDDQIYSLTKNNNWIIISKNQNLESIKGDICLLYETDYYIHVDEKISKNFTDVFCFYIMPEINGIKILNFDNLINLCIMVKNGGKQFEQMLIDNSPFIDKWTILDTGSTDETIDIINRVLVGKKEGKLYQEPFINFRDSRNRLLDLAGLDCKYNLMLDDTYVIKENLREFLTEVRSDQYSNSFTLFITSDDTKYGSNRIIKSDSGLRYIHKIHEVITDKDNINIVIPENRAMIEDRRFDYMEKRTMERKQLDLKLLYEEIEENPHDPRAYYYLAQTYNLLENYEKAFYYFIKRSEIINAGFLQERVDALFEASRIANFKLNKPWSECFELYEKCYNADESRPEALYFIGCHYYLENNYKEAFPYFKKAFDIGFPIHCQYSLKPTLSYHFLPKLLTKICYELNEYQVGKEASLFYLSNNESSADSYEEILSWYKIFDKLTINTELSKPHIPEKPIFCFHADGGFDYWTGSSIITTGVGGSETYIIELARQIQQSGLFDVYVFCNCKEEENFEGVIYKPLNEYYSFIRQNYINTCIVSRYSEYLPVTFNGWTENVYFVIHDLTPSGIVIPLNKKLKKVFCLTEWHVEYFINIFPQLKEITVPFYYGIDFNKFKSDNIQLKEKYKFIYSSFPNRGLLQLLQMWPKIYKIQPLVSLHIYCDINGKWVNQVEGEMMKTIKKLMDDYKVKEHNMNIYYHGWVDKKTLANAWLTSDIWFYPCTFMETFCLTALEAALTKTLVITNDLAALQNTVGQRGIIIKGDPKNDEWQEIALKKIKYYIDPSNEKVKNKFIERNFLWASQLSWENQANKLLNEYILNEKLEYKGMYNWTNDLPFDNKKYFVETIKYFNNVYPKVQNGEKIKILEIGTYTGISLINIVKLIPNSLGYGVDRWINYEEIELLNNIDELQIESSFYKNVCSEGLEERIFGIKGDSEKVLFDMVLKNDTYDFIYVDGSHLMLDCYSDLILSWKILNKDGILAIDDYLYNLGNKLITDSPYEAVNHFIKKYESEIKILHKGYRVFIQKI